MTEKQVLETFHKARLFSGLTNGELEEIAKLCREEVHEAGTTIFAEDAPAQDLYVVQEGSVVLEVKLRLGSGPGRQSAVEVVTPNHAFGWSAVGGSHVRTLSARCLHKTRLLTINGQRLERLMEQDTHIGYVIMGNLLTLVSNRQRHTRDTLAHILSIASHDLKAPLAAVESYHKVILGGYAGPITEQQKQMLLRCSDRIIGLLNLIDNILDISRFETKELKFRSFSLTDVLERSVETVRPLAEEKGIKISLELPEKALPPIIGDQERLQQVFNNLLDNANKFTQAQGTIHVGLSEEKVQVKVEVRDTGVGISPEDLPRIFDSFYRGFSTETKGAGLGLSIAKKIVEAHGGRIWAESPCPETGKGSKFTVVLPRNPEESKN